MGLRNTTEARLDRIPRFRCEQDLSNRQRGFGLFNFTCNTEGYTEVDTREICVWEKDMVSKKKTPFPHSLPHRPGFDSNLSMAS